MAGVHGKQGRNVEKQSVKESAFPSTGFKNVRALHEATVGDTLIDITALVAPVAAISNGYSAPNASDLQKVSLRQFKENVTLRTGTTTLIQDIDFVILGARTIRLETPAIAAQIYELIVNAEPRVGTSLVDAQPLISTGVLGAGATDFNVGIPFKVGQFLTQRAGAVSVFANGILQQRNISNQSATAGDYFEVHAGAGLGVIIRFNTPSGSARDISVFSVGALAERPDGSQDAMIDGLAGQIDVIRSTVETQHGITIPIGAPNNIDLKAFGDRVLQNEEDIIVLQGMGGGGGLANIVEDLTPELGGNLDINGFDLTSAVGLDVTIGNSAGDDFTINATGLVFEGDTGNLGLGAVPGADTILDLSSNAGKGFGFPVMPGFIRDGIASPSGGMAIFNVTTSQLDYFNGAAWFPIGTGVGGSMSNLVEDLTPEFGGDVNTGGFDFVIPTGDTFGFLGQATNDEVRVRVRTLNTRSSSQVFENPFGHEFIIGLQGSGGGLPAPGGLIPGVGLGAFSGVVVAPVTSSLHLGANGIVNASFEPSNGFLYLSNVSFGATERLFVDGRIQIADGVVPGITTNKLYSVGGNLFWNGVQLN